MLRFLDFSSSISVKQKCLWCKTSRGNIEALPAHGLQTAGSGALGEEEDSYMTFARPQIGACRALWAERRLTGRLNTAAAAEERQREKKERHEGAVEFASQEHRAAGRKSIFKKESQEIFSSFVKA